MTGPRNSPSDSQSVDAASRLEWTAFLYVAGELSESESDEFEELLGSDSRACEAVANAVRLTESIQSTFTAGQRVPAEFDCRAAVSPPERDRRRSSTAVRAIVVVAGVALAVLFFAMQHRDRNVTDTLQMDSDTTPASEMVRLWVDTPLQPDLPRDLLIADFSGDIPDVPEWMLAAVQLEDAQRRHAQPEIMEN